MQKLYTNNILQHTENLQIRLPKIIPKIVKISLPISKTFIFNSLTYDYNENKNTFLILKQEAKLYFCQNINISPLVIWLVKF